MVDTDARQFAIELARITHDHKCEEVTAMDLRGMSPVTDFTVIATGTSDRQMRALTDRLTEYAKKVGEKPFGISGYHAGTWILIDFVDVVVHIFARPYRAYYDLELLWGDAPRLEWARSVTA
ncbi:MAG: ribosome silencing factor [Phycisphaerae bacterium]